MREVNASQITDTVARLCIEANYYLPEDVVRALREAANNEESDVGRDVLQQLLKNADLAATEGIPICQDTGFAVVFVELGQDVHVVGGDFNEAIDEGVRRGYVEGYLRKSVANPPIFERTNTKYNTPAVIHTDVVPGESLKLTVMTKGGGSENVAGLAMLTPAQGAAAIMDFVVRTVEKAGSNPCPPIVVGVGIGGTVDKTILLAKEALLREIGSKNPEPRFAEMEDEVLRRVNALGIGPQGFGGRTTALAVHVETFPVHIASLPVAVNIQCHAARHKSAML